MRVLLSSPRPTGHLAVVRLPHGARFTARYVDDAADRERDITALVADLLLSGALDRAQATSEDRPEPAQSVEVAVVSYSEPLLPGQVRAASSFTWTHVPSRTGGDFGAEEVLDLIARGIGVELTAGVAAEVAAEATPQDASSITDD